MENGSVLSKSECVVNGNHKILLLGRCRPLAKDGRMAKTLCNTSGMFELARIVRIRGYARFDLNGEVYHTSGWSRNYKRYGFL